MDHFINSLPIATIFACILIPVYCEVIDVTYSFQCSKSELVTGLQHAVYQYFFITEPETN